MGKLIPYPFNPARYNYSLKQRIFPTNATFGPIQNFEIGKPQGASETSARFGHVRKADRELVGKFALQTALYQWCVTRSELRGQAFSNRCRSLTQQSSLREFKDDQSCTCQKSAASLVASF
jgi:hypothetical protein